MQLANIILRQAVAQDAPAITACVRAAYAHYTARLGVVPMPMRDDYAAAIRERDVTVAALGVDIVGIVVLTTTDEGFLLENVAAHPSQQGTGVGRLLLQHAEAAARRAGYDSLYLYTHEGMRENLDLYARIGYVEYARRVEGDLARVYLRKKLT